MLDRLEAGLYQPAELRVGHRRDPGRARSRALIDRLAGRDLPWRDRRRIFVETLARPTRPAAAGEPGRGAKVWPRLTTSQVWRRLRTRRSLERARRADADLIDAWLLADGDGALADEVRARFEGVPARYAHVIVDEAQDLTLLQLRAVHAPGRRR